MLGLGDEAAMKKKPQRYTYEVPVASDVWDTIQGDERTVFTSVAGWGNRSAVCAWLRSDRPLRRELRDLIADFLEGKYKRSAHRPVRPALIDQHNARRAALKREQREIAAQLKAKGIRSPKEAAKVELCKRRNFSEAQLKRALELLPPPKAKPKAKT